MGHPNPRLARDIVGEEHFRVVKLNPGVEGEDGGVVSKDNPLPVAESSSNQSPVSLLKSILTQLMILNKNISNITNQVIQESDIDELDRREQF